MLKFPCLILDHDDTVVQSEATVNFPCFCEFLEQYRPGTNISLKEYVEGCSQMPFVQMCQSRFSMTEAEMDLEYQYWKNYAKNHIPAPFPGIREFLHNYRAKGGKVCVVSMSAQENILRDYMAHYDFEPDLVYGWDLPEECRKPSIWAIEQVKMNYGFTSDQILVVDDMKFAVDMARNSGCPIAFAGWGRRDFPHICEEMEKLCDYSFYSVEELQNFLFD